MVKKPFVESEPVLAWVAQFAPDDQDHALDMLRAMRLVSSDEFVRGIRARLREAANETAGAIALYTEREVPPKNKPPLPLFEQPAQPPRKAVGARLTAVPEDEDVGSEGLIAQLITELTRPDSGKFLNHPGPDRLRGDMTIRRGGKQRLPVRKFIIVTDLVGSGTRAWRFLEAAWGVATIKSLFSTRNRKGLSFEIVTYAATDVGARLVRSHPLKPLIRAVGVCPTIRSSFSASRAAELESLCERYDPCGGRGALGYKDTGALIAFAHGAPNNSPRILCETRDAWEALFPKRVAADSRDSFGQEVDADAVNARLTAMRHRRLADDIDWEATPVGALERYLVLAALSHPPRNSLVVASRTGLTLLEVERLLQEASTFKWIDKQLRLTDAGQAQLSVAKERSPRKDSPRPTRVYYPSALRAPRISSS